MMEPQNASPEVLASTGTKVTGERVARSPARTVESGAVYEGHFDLNPRPRNLTKREAGIYLPSFVRQFKLKRPDVKVEYSDIRSAPRSPEVQRLVVQFSIRGSPLPPLAVIIGAVIAGAVIASVVALVALTVAPVLKTVYEVITKPVPKPVMWLAYLIPIGIIGYIAYRLVGKRLLKKVR